MENNFFQKKTILITGGLGFLGKSLASRFASKGSNIVLIDKVLDEGNFLEELSDKYGVEINLLHQDFLEKDSFKEIKNYFTKNSKGLDFIVNNAAFYDSIPGWGVNFEEETYEAWLAVLKVNLLTPFFLTQTMQDTLKKSSCPAIVNVSSIYGLIAPDRNLYEGTEMTNPAVYAASKGGLIQLTKWLSSYLSPEIRVNSVSPGGIERGQNELFKERYEKKTLLGKMAIEEDISGVIEFLLSSDSSYMTGQNLIVDAGYTVT